MRVISINVNGIRSAVRKGLLHWLEHQHADVVCLQEVKAQLELEVAESLILPGYEYYFADAQKKGYSGVGIYSRRKPLKVKIGFGWPHADNEGRYIQIDYPHLSVVSVYLPSGSSGELRQAVKFEFLEHFYRHLEELKQQQRDFILCGDWNIAHKQIDLKNWRGNQKNSGFLPEERAWMDKVLGVGGWVDAFRVVNQEADQYTWWSNRGQAWAKNVGWRIDYQIVSPNLRDKVRDASIYKDHRFSDHAPLIIDYDLP